MNKANRSRRFALAALLATAAIGSAAPAQASTDCDARLDQLEAQFRQIEDARGWEAATEWWQKRWYAYYQSCGGPLRGHDRFVDLRRAAQRPGVVRVRLTGAAHQSTLGHAVKGVGAPCQRAV